jgi:hypothetical protein
VIRFVVTTGHHGPSRETREASESPPMELVTYDQLIAAKRLRGVTTVFADLDRLSQADLELAALVHHSLTAEKVPALNDPARVKTRYGLLRALHEAGLNDFNVYRADEERLPKRYPVFVRRDSGHGEPLSGLLGDRDAVARAIEAAVAAGIPASNLLIIEYSAEPVTPGVFRKLAMTRIGDRLLPQISVHDDQWLVKYGNVGVATEALYREESRLLEELPYADELWRAFEIAAISYGRADFGLVGGRVQIYEINTNPSVKPGEEHPSQTRQANLRSVWCAHLAALRDLDSKHAGSDFVALRHKRLRKFQGLRLRPHLTRRVP